MVLTMMSDPNAGARAGRPRAARRATPAPGPLAAATGEVERVSDELVKRIVRGDYPAGLRLPSEVELAKALDCGRSTLREALSRVSTMGLVKSRRGSGALVRDYRREGTPSLLPPYVLTGAHDGPPLELAAELLHLRSLLAREAVRLAARYATSETLAEPRDILARAPSLERDPLAHAHNELELFRAFVVASRMWPAVWLANSFWESLRSLYDSLAGAVAEVPKGFQPTMERLFELVAARDERRALAHLDRWLGGVDAELLRGVASVLGHAPEGTAPGGTKGSRAAPRRNTVETRGGRSR